MRTSVTLAQYKLLIVFMKRPGTGLSFEVPIAIHAIIHTFLQKKAGLDPDSAIQFITDYAFLINSR